MQITNTGAVFCDPHSTDPADAYKFWPVHVNENTENPGSGYSHLGVFVRVVQITYEVPDNFDSREGAVKIIRERMRQDEAEFEQRRNTYLRQIQELLAITDAREGA